MDAELNTKINRLLVISEENGKKLDQVYKCIYIGNGDPPMKVTQDRNSQKIKLLLWIVGVLFIASTAAIASGVFG